MRKIARSVAVVCLVVSAAVGQTAIGQTVTGSLSKWETVTLDFAGPSSSELAGRSQVGQISSQPNPFLDYRLQVDFTSPSGQTYSVPGFFDGDGQGGGAGNVWRTRFTPDEVGDWSYTTSFREGVNVAIDLNAAAGSASNLIDGTSGSFQIGAASQDATGHFATGRLEYVGEHYLKRRDGGFWIKSGADSPENFLGYRGFDNTQTKGNSGPGRRGILHNFDGHVNDYNPGDPAFDTPDFDFGNSLVEGGDARNIIGYLNYLSSVGVNSQYFLANNVGGDGQDAHPFAAISTPAQLSGETNSGAANDNLHYDISKLSQWETVFRHAQSQDIHLHFVLNEAEFANKQELDDGTLGVERRLYYRELVARFGHHNALQWNLSEEYDLGNGFGNNQAEEASRINAFADYLSAVDPYDHPVTVHQVGTNNFFNADQIATNSPYAPFIPDADFDLTSLQRAGQAEGWSDVVEAFRTATAAAGRPLAIHVDEPESITRIAVGVNDDTEPGNTLAERFNTVRKTMAWDILLSGGGGVEWFINDADQDVEDQRIYEQVYRETAIARRFLEENTRFWELTPNDELLSGEDNDYGGGEVLADEGELYAIYLPDGSNDDNGPNTQPDLLRTPQLDLTDFAGEEFTLRWFDPQTGEFDPVVVTLAGGTDAHLGFTPDGFQNTNDWAALVLRVDGDANEDSLVNAADFTLLRDTFGAAVGPGGLGDANGDSLVNAADFEVFSRQFGVDGPQPVAVAIPEPLSFGLAVIPLAGCLCRRSRRLAIVQQACARSGHRSAPTAPLRRTSGDARGGSCRRFGSREPRFAIPATANAPEKTEFGSPLSMLLLVVWIALPSMLSIFSMKIVATVPLNSCTGSLLTNELSLSLMMPKAAAPLTTARRIHSRQPGDFSWPT